MKVIKIVIGPGQQGIGHISGSSVRGRPHHKGLKRADLLLIHAHHRKLIHIAVEGSSEGHAYCVLHSEQQHGAFRTHDHVFLASQHIPLVEIPAVDHIHRLHVNIVIINSFKIKGYSRLLVDGVGTGAHSAVNVGNLIPKYLFHPLHLVQGKVVALPYLIHPVADGNICLGHAHILIQVRKQAPHGIADRDDGDYGSDADYNAKHGEKRPHLVNLDGGKCHTHILKQHYVVSPFLLSLITTPS